MKKIIKTIFLVIAFAPSASYEAVHNNTFEEALTQVKMLQKAKTTNVVAAPIPTIHIKKVKTPKHVAKYIDTYIETTKQVCDTSTVPYLYALAQPAIEGGWGRSANAKNANNHCGIKAMEGFARYGKWTKFKSKKQCIEQYVRLIVKYGKGATTVEELAHNISLSKYAGFIKDHKRPPTKKELEEAAKYERKVLAAARMISLYLKTK